ncbi:hypothetical protein ABZ297_46795 [Nonomuraea sp. NPDC005983]|uniref:hypothetical protein n=1 Tax=Nonomuraea sp. NPDC005983 TaxID=3155595 RepID=UPI0033A653B6
MIHIVRQGEVGSGDALIRAMRLVAAALSGMATAAHTAIDPLRGDGEAADAGQALIKAAAVLQEASIRNNPWVPEHLARSFGPRTRAFSV